MNRNGADWTKKALRIAGLVILDAALVISAAFLALFVRLDMNIGALRSQYLPQLIHALPFFVLLSVAVFVPAKLYNSLWQFAGID